MNRVKSTIMSAVALFLSGCAILAPEPTATPAPTPTPAPVPITNVDQIIGIWQETLTQGGARVGTFLHFKEDGTYTVAGELVSNLEDSPQEQGQFKFDGGLITIVASDESALCAGQSGTYEVHLTREGRLDFSQREDPCGIRDYHFNEKLFLPFSP